MTSWRDGYVCSVRGAGEGLGPAVTDAVPSGLTVIEAIERLRSDGYMQGFSVVGGALRCGACGWSHSAEGVEIEVALRVEGASDPADEAIVMGLRCDACQSSGVLVAGYGPTADPVESAVVLRLGQGDRPV